MMNSHHTNKHVRELYEISHETVKHWTTEFARYLSPSATPPAGSKRVFTDSDLAVFALVADYKKRGLTYADAHLALQSGQRGEIPNPTALDRLPLVVQDMIVRMRDEMAEMREQVKNLASERDMERGKVQLLEKQLADKEREIRELLRNQDK